MPPVIAPVPTSTIYLHVFLLLHFKMEAKFPMPSGWHFWVATSLVTPATCNLTFIDSSVHVVNEGILKRVWPLGSCLFFSVGEKDVCKKMLEIQEGHLISCFSLCFVPVFCLIMSYFFNVCSYVFEWLVQILQISGSSCTAALQQNLKTLWGSTML